MCLTDSMEGGGGGVKPPKPSLESATDNGFLGITWATFVIGHSSSSLKTDKILILYHSRVMSLENSKKVQYYFISGW